MTYVAAYFGQRETERSDIYPYIPANLCFLFQFQKTTNCCRERTNLKLMINSPKFSIHKTFDMNS